jgi:hypothetical protein
VFRKSLILRQQKQFEKKLNFINETDVADVILRALFG